MDIRPQTCREDTKGRGSGCLKQDNRLRKAVFADQSVYKSFLELKSGKFEEKELASYIQRAIDDLTSNPLIGVGIPKRL